MSRNPSKAPARVLGLGGAIALWFVVVALGSTAVWAVISRAGDGVVGAPAPRGQVGAGPSASRSTATPQPGTSFRSSPSATRSSKPATGPSSSPVEPWSPTLTDDPSTPSSPSTHGTGGHHTGGPSSPTSSSSSNGPVRRTWSRSGVGWVTVECKGSSITLAGASPEDGWGIEKDSTGTRVHVHFEEYQGDGEAEVTAVCKSGVPDFSTGSDRD